MTDSEIRYLTEPMYTCEILECEQADRRLSRLEFDDRWGPGLEQFCIHRLRQGKLYFEEGELAK
jgi:hypothetical protein